MKNIPNCTRCGSEFTYEDRDLYICPECGYEWKENKEPETTTPTETIIKDAFGNILKDGDNVTIIKDIKVKGSSSAIKVGVKIKGIRLIEEVNGHNIEAKVPGFGSMLLKSEVVKKAN